LLLVTANPGVTEHQFMVKGAQSNRDLHPGSQTGSNP